jgi:hypothetical protein
LAQRTRRLDSPAPPRGGALVRYFDKDAGVFGAARLTIGICIEVSIQQIFVRQSLSHVQGMDAYAKSANPFFATFLLRPRAPSLFAGSFAGTSNEMFGRFQACKSAR